MPTFDSIVSVEAIKNPMCDFFSVAALCAACFPFCCGIERGIEYCFFILVLYRSFKFWYGDFSLERFKQLTSERVDRN